jgi:hypothetical protein
MNDDEEITIVDPEPLIAPISDDECWDKLTNADLDMMGMERTEWEATRKGNPCRPSSGKDV